MKALVGAFNQEKALVGAFSVIVQLHRLTDLRHYTRPGSLSRMESRVASTAASSGIKPWNLKKVMRLDHSASSSNLQEELIALVTDCKIMLLFIVYCLCLLLHSISRLGAAAACYRDLPPAWPEAV